MELNHIPVIFHLKNERLQFVYDTADHVAEDTNNNDIYCLFAMGQGLYLAFAHIISLQLHHLGLRWPLLLSLQMRTVRLREGTS